jgi:hypothetical protein
MLFRIGRFLQAAGMLILPIGMAGNILDPDHVSVKDSLLIAAVGCLVFGAGWVLQQATRPK